LAIRWCFIDESWHEGEKEHVGTIAAAVGAKEDFEELGRIFYRLRNKYYGEKNARDLRSELKGKDLFSNHSFKQQMAGFSKNLSLAREIVEWLPTSNIRLVGICIYGDARPPLLAPNLKSLSTPFRELCVRILSHIAEPQSGQLIFDQRLGAQEDISVAVYNYLAGIRENQRLNPHPLIGVSNVWPGLQLADIVAHILGRYAAGDEKVAFYHKKIIQVQTHGKDHRNRSVFGFLRLQWKGDDNFMTRKIRTKK
jgi:hypothetical protein